MEYWWYVRAYLPTGYTSTRVFYGTRLDFLESLAKWNRPASVGGRKDLWKYWEDITYNADTLV